jgi:hypothetical protein
MKVAEYYSISMSHLIRQHNVEPQAAGHSVTFVLMLELGLTAKSCVEERNKHAITILSSVLVVDEKQ